MTSAPSPPPELTWFDISITSEELPNLFKIVFTLSVGDNVVSESLVIATGIPNSLIYHTCIWILIDYSLFLVNYFQ